MIFHIYEYLECYYKKLDIEEKQKGDLITNLTMHVLNMFIDYLCVSSGSNISYVLMKDYHNNNLDIFQKELLDGFRIIYLLNNYTYDGNAMKKHFEFSKKQKSIFPDKLLLETLLRNFIGNVKSNITNCINYALSNFTTMCDINNYEISKRNPSIEYVNIQLKPLPFGYCRNNIITNHISIQFNHNKRNYHMYPNIHKKENEKKFVILSKKFNQYKNEFPVKDVICFLINITNIHIHIVIVLGKLTCTNCI